MLYLIDASEDVGYYNLLLEVLRNKINISGAYLIGLIDIKHDISLDNLYCIQLRSIQDAITYGVDAVVFGCQTHSDSVEFLIDTGYTVFMREDEMINKKLLLRVKDVSFISKNATEDKE